MQNRLPLFFCSNKPRFRRNPLFDRFQRAGKNFSLFLRLGGKFGSSFSASRRSLRIAQSSLQNRFRFFLDLVFFGAFQTYNPADEIVCPLKPVDPWSISFSVPRLKDVREVFGFPIFLGVELLDLSLDLRSQKPFDHRFRLIFGNDPKVFQGVGHFVRERGVGLASVTADENGRLVARDVAEVSKLLDDVVGIVLLQLKLFVRKLLHLGLHLRQGHGLIKGQKLDGLGLAFDRHLMHSSTFVFDL